ncbi:mitochondrial integral membrane protein-like protein [Cucurbitaria berberidis CBS 394.84]|uniref:Mitochondrial integral membrane protein-like protein n=1 Tax=Cucurbitaria berberidis CBS 394.84 TaxID=1168544 RepID=A0A9P4G7P7_9PLEO|nr:mitochondrial integral membrane protein-like protein [Cucurbitaria berberidis CBS 394.84]KAF1840573.1 mitochondrial integral membrane protein-like protein [Cucurbitaria berberidis CBS 394.84]
MSSMWKGGKKEQQDNDQLTAEPPHPIQDDGASRSSRRSYEPSRRSAEPRDEPNERTRLLDRPRPPNSDGYLDPDDPAVSPYNLWTVRAMRYLTILFLIVSFLWWVLLLVSIFVSPPGLHTRGSGFFDFAYTCLTIGNLLVATIFFVTPAQGLRITTAIIAVLLAVDMILIVSVPRIRLEEGWVGIASVVWAFVMAVWCILTDRVVAYGKKEEEERLTGRAETRRTLKEWVAVLVATILTVVFIIIVILMTATLGMRARDSTLKMYGDRILVDGDKYAVHLACVGNDSYTDGSRDPTVLLEAGEAPLEYDFEHWAYAAYKNGTISRYCYWDRPGYAFSDNAPSPHSAGMSADALSEALAKAGEEGPWILVSAGTGTIVSRIFSSRHMKQVTGLLLIDPYHEDLLHRIGSPSRGFMLWAWGIISPLGTVRLAGALFKGRTREDRVYGRNAYQSGKQIKAQLQENLVADSLSKNEVASARNIQSSDTALAIVSSGIEVRRDSEWERKQKDLTTLTDNLVGWDVVNKAPHQVWHTLEGRTVMEKRLKALVKAAAKVKHSTEE